MAPLVGAGAVQAAAYAAHIWAEPSLGHSSLSTRYEHQQRQCLEQPSHPARLMKVGLVRSVTQPEYKHILRTQRYQSKNRSSSFVYHHGLCSDMSVRSDYW